MALIGIIANPSSGKDIRRLVAEASGTDNQQKVNIVRRVLLGIAAIGVDEVSVMPDYFGIGARALDGLQLPFRTTTLEMLVRATQEDSQEAARMLCRREADCIVVLGGDGTHRVVGKGCGRVPLVPISMGTNNVWPQQNEGTLAGLAAALVAQSVVPTDQAVRPTNRLEIERDGSLVEIALVDVATYDSAFIGSKAVWDLDRVGEIVLTKVQAGTLGLSSIGGGLPKPNESEAFGLHVRIGGGGGSVLAPIAPGVIRRVPVQACRWLRLGDSVFITHKPCILALDGEREIVVSPTDPIHIRLTANGPQMVDVQATLSAAADMGYFVQGKEWNHETHERKPRGDRL